MTLQELRFIIALAREQHFRKAADACFVSQPTLSIAVNKLEQELKVSLFERHKNAVRLTPVGKDIIERAKRVLAEAEGIKLAAVADKDQLTGPLKIGAIYTIGLYLLPPLILALNKLAPQMPIDIQENYTANLREKLVSGEVDAIIVSEPFSGPGIVTRVLYKEPFVVLMPIDHPLAKQKSISDSALMDYPLLMLGEGHCFRDQIISSCPSCFVSKGTPYTVEGSSLETIRMMVASKMGLTILPLTAAHMGPFYDKVLTTRPLKTPGAGRTVVLAWRKTFPRVKAIEMIIQSVAKNAELDVILNK